MFMTERVRMLGCLLCIGGLLFAESDSRKLNEQYATVEGGRT